MFENIGERFCFVDFIRCEELQTIRDITLGQIAQYFEDRAQQTTDPTQEEQVINILTKIHNYMRDIFNNNGIILTYSRKEERQEAHIIGEYKLIDKLHEYMKLHDIINQRIKKNGDCRLRRRKIRMRGEKMFDSIKGSQYQYLQYRRSIDMVRFRLETLKYIMREVPGSSQTFEY